MTERKRAPKGNIYAAWEDTIIRTVIRDAITHTIEVSRERDGSVRSLAQFVTLFNEANGSTVSETTVRRWLKALGISYRTEMILSLDANSPLIPTQTEEIDIDTEEAPTPMEEPAPVAPSRPRAAGLQPGVGGLVP